MIRAFNATDKLYSSNGDAVILPTKARVKNSDNGDYYLELTCGIEYNDYIQANNIIVAPTPRGDQAFRIRTVTKNKNKLEVKAWHVFYDSQNYLIADSYAVNLNCNAALDHFNNATDNPSPFTVSSNVATINSYRCVRTSLAECINTVLERWGGHLVRDNWNISILQDIGVDNGITIQYKKNLKELTASYDWSGVVTKLMPVGKDGILLDELYIYSDIQYDIPYTKTVSFEQDTILEEDYQDSSGELDEDAYKAALKEDLLTQAVNYLKVYSLPVVNYTLKGNPEKVTDIGDSIEVIDERIGVNILTEVIAYEYDAIANKYVNLEFGNFTNTLSDLLSNISSSTDSQVGSAVVTLMSELTEALDEAQSKIWDALSSSYCIYEGDKILIVDKLPASRATNVIMINSAGIGFSNTGINGQFTTAWTIDGTFNAQAINIINLTADLIKGGTLKLGSLLNQSGKIEVYDEANTLICTIDKNGLIMYASNGSYVVLNQDVGLVGYDGAGNPIYWVTNDSFNMSKAVVTQEITLCNKVRFIGITIYDNNNNITNDGVGLVSTIN
jgi:phage minor structural protein